MAPYQMVAVAMCVALLPAGASAKTPKPRPSATAVKAPQPEPVAPEPIKPERLIVPGAAVGRILIGTSTRQDLARVLGPNEKPEDKGWHYSEPGSTAGHQRSYLVFFDDFGLVRRVFILEVGGSSFGTSAGVRMNSTRDEVVREFGTDHTRTDDGLRYEAAGIEFAFTKDRVSAISVFQGAKTPDGKPTLAQTYQFIQTYFDDDFFRDGKYFQCGNAYGSDDYRVVKLAIKTIDFEGCVLKSSYSETAYYVSSILSKDTRLIEHSTDLSKVTEVVLGSRGEQYLCYGMIFKPSSSDEFVLPFARTDKGSFSTMREEKIVKAIAHARKLCGAPEPISFD